MTGQRRRCGHWPSRCMPAFLFAGSRAKIQQSIAPSDRPSARAKRVLSRRAVDSAAQRCTHSGKERVATHAHGPVLGPGEVSQPSSRRGKRSRLLTLPACPATNRCRLASGPKSRRRRTTFFSTSQMTNKHRLPVGRNGARSCDSCGRPRASVWAPSDPARCESGGICETRVSPSCNDRLSSSMPSTRDAEGRAAGSLARTPLTVRRSGTNRTSLTILHHSFIQAKRCRPSAHMTAARATGRHTVVWAADWCRDAQARHARLVRCEILPKALLFHGNKMRVKAATLTVEGGEISPVLTAPEP